MGTLSTFVKRIRDIMRNDAGINGDAQRIEQIAWMLFLKVYDVKEQDWEFNEEDYVSIIPEECRWNSWAADDKSGSAMTGDKLLDFVNNTLFPTLKTLPVTPQTPIKKSIVKTTFEDANQYMKDGVLLRQIINVIDELDLSDTAESHAFGEIYESILCELQSAGSSGEFYTPRAVTEFMAQMINPQIGEKMADFACGTGGFITSWLNALAPKIRTTEDQAAYDTSIYGIEKKQFPYMLCVTNMLLHDIELPQIFHDNSLLRDLLDYTEDDQFDVILMNPPYGGSEKADVKNHFPNDLASSETADLFMAVIMYRLKKNGRAAVILPDGFLFGTDNAKVALKKKLLKEFNLHTVIRMPGSVFAPYTSITTNILFFDNTAPAGETWFYRMDMPEGYKHFSKTKPMKLEHFDAVKAWWNDRREITLDGYDKAKKYTAEQLTDEFGYNLDLCGYPHEEEEILDPFDLIRKYQEERASLNAVVDRALSHIETILSDEVGFTDFKNIDGALGRLSEIDRTFPDEMRVSILQTAIQGKLVEQRPEEGTGEELYRQIQAEKAKLVKEGKIKKEKPLPEIAEDEVPFEIPDNWKWYRIGEVFNIVNGFTPLKSNPEFWENGEIPWFTIDDVHQQGRFIRSTAKKITSYALSKNTSRIVPANTVLLCCTASVGEYAYTTIPLTTNQQFNALVVKQEFKNAVFPLYVFEFAKSLKNALLEKAGKTTFNFLSVGKLSDMLIPLPPLAEQKRIVAKLEELLPLCERLK